MTRKYLAGAAAGSLLILLSAPPAAQSLRGSPTSVDRIYRQAVNHDLEFFRTAGSIREAHSSGDLVRLNGDRNYELVAVSYPYVVPATYTFVVRLASQYRSACGEKLVVTSATRPTNMRLANSVDESVHPTGMAVDLRKPRNSRCLRWLRDTLLSLEGSGLLDAVEERNPAHFHVAVFPRPYQRYVLGKTGGTQPASSQRASAPEPRSYQVHRGDSLWEIARRNDITVDRLREVNNLRSSRILAGQVLMIPTGR